MKGMLYVQDPCFHCVAPERYPGCHDHCDKRKTYLESDEYKKLQEYKDTYFRSHSCKNIVAIHHDMRRKKNKGISLLGYKGVR